MSKTSSNNHLMLFVAGGRFNVLQIDDEDLEYARKRQFQGIIITTYEPLPVAHASGCNFSPDEARVLLDQLPPLTYS